MILGAAAGEGDALVPFGSAIGEGKDVMLMKLFGRKPPVPATVSVGDQAGRLFDGGMNCAQAVLQATTGVADPEIMAMAAAFGGGLGGSQCLCGAVSGGVMALGLRRKSKLSGELVAAFRQRHRATCCKVLSAPFPWQSQDHRAQCRRLTVETAEMVARLLE
jgi:C_GCAxxG_C_C family probable redox protein